MLHLASAATSTRIPRRKKERKFRSASQGLVEVNIPRRAPGLPSSCEARDRPQVPRLKNLQKASTSGPDQRSGTFRYLHGIQGRLPRPAKRLEQLGPSFPVGGGHALVRFLKPSIQNCRLTWAQQGFSMNVGQFQSVCPTEADVTA